MATSAEFVQYVCDQIRACGAIRSRKMFGEYMVYVEEKPILLLCDNTVFVKKLPELTPFLTRTGYPYEGAKEHYILDADDAAQMQRIVARLLPLTPLPKRKR